jgi:PIN domain nuclease of toxin-antitoxin system
VVEERLVDGARCGAANWSEVGQKVLSAGRDWDLARALLTSYDVIVDAVLVDDAEWAAHRWTAGEGLSLADRLCLALAERTDEDAWTADTTWGSSGRVRQIRWRAATRGRCERDQQIRQILRLA